MSKGQWLAILGCVALGASLYAFGERTNLSNNEKQLTGTETPSPKNFDEAKLIANAKESLNAQDAKKIALLEKALEKVDSKPDKTVAIEQIIGFWEAQTRWEASAIYHQKKAQLTNSAIDWADAASRYLAAADMMPDATLQAEIKQKALASFEKASSLEPQNIDLKADLGNAYTLCTPQNPMKGVIMLREIVAKDSTNLRANFHLAQLAVRSGQMDKAINRFAKIVRMYPAFPDAYLGLGEAYYQTGDNKQAKEILMQYKALVKDPSITQQVDAFLKQIK